MTCKWSAVISSIYMHGKVSSGLWWFLQVLDGLCCMVSTGLSWSPLVSAVLQWSPLVYSYLIFTPAYTSNPAPNLTLPHSPHTHFFGAHACGESGNETISGVARMTELPGHCYSMGTHTCALPNAVPGGCEIRT